MSLNYSLVKTEKASLVLLIFLVCLIKGNFLPFFDATQSETQLQSISRDGFEKIGYTKHLFKDDEHHFPFLPSLPCFFFLFIFPFLLFFFEGGRDIERETASCDS